MAITTIDGWLAAAKQNVLLHRTGTRTGDADSLYTAIFDLAGNPGAGTAAVGNTANGIVPTDATAGHPTINAFGGGATGYLTNVMATHSVTVRLIVYDRLFSCGAYAFNANTALASQPSFSGRVPGSDFSGLEIWAEMVTAATGNQAVTVTYTNEAGTASRSTGAVGIAAAPVAGQMWPLPLQAGDKGVQLISNVQGTVATAGTFNVHVMRRLWMGRPFNACLGDTEDLFQTGMPVVFADSALYGIARPDGASTTGQIETMLTIANG